MIHLSCAGGPSPEALWRGLRSHGAPSGRVERNGEGGGERRLVHLRRLGLGLLPEHRGLFAGDGSRHLAGVWHGALEIAVWGKSWLRKGRLPSGKATYL